MDFAVGMAVGAAILTVQHKLGVAGWVSTAGFGIGAVLYHLLKG